MGKATTVECPSWCIEPHTEANWMRGGFHHDGPDVTLDFTTGSHTDHVASGWHVKPTQYVGDDEARTVDPPRVEIQDDRHVIAVLTPADALQLAAMLEQAAAVADPNSAACERDRRAAEGIDLTAGEAHAMWPLLFPVREP